MRRFAPALLICLPLACRASTEERLARDYVDLVNAAERGEGSSDRARALFEALSDLEPAPRSDFLKRQTEALVARYDALEGGRISFDEESFRLYGVVAPPPDLDEAARLRAELDSLLPGEGPLVTRYAHFQRRFLVPRERVETALRRAIEECRRRTLAHLPLPPEEKTELELVSGRDWPAFSSYQGNYQSVIRVNVDFPIPVGRVVEIAAHEAYPGHHTASVVRDEKLVRERNLEEYSVEPLVGPDAYLREALAAVAVELVFSPEERLEFERGVLFPLARIDAADAELHAEVERLACRLRPLLVDAARQYLDRKRDRVATAIWLEKEAVVPDPWAFLRFVDRYRTYVVTYTASRSPSWSSFESLLLVNPHEPT
jgi:hypothetical protein